MQTEQQRAYRLGEQIGTQSGYLAGEQAGRQRIEEQQQLIHKAIDVLERHYTGKPIPPDIRALLAELEAYS